jgi:hypothetical protein
MGRITGLSGDTANDQNGSVPEEVELTGYRYGHLWFRIPEKWSMD